MGSLYRHWRRRRPVQVGDAVPDRVESDRDRAVVSAVVGGVAFPAKRFRRDAAIGNLDMGLSKTGSYVNEDCHFLERVNRSAGGGWSVPDSFCFASVEVGGIGYREAEIPQTSSLDREIK